MTGQDLIEMTPEQQKAFNRMKRAANDFKKLGGMFYTVLHKVHGLNGEYVESIEADYMGNGNIDGHLNTNFDVFMDCINDAGLSGFADDTHMIKLNSKGLELWQGN